MWKKVGDSPPFDEPSCFFPGVTYGVVFFQPAEKNY